MKPRCQRRRATGPAPLCKAEVGDLFDLVAPSRRIRADGGAVKDLILLLRNCRPEWPGARPQPPKRKKPRHQKKTIQQQGAL